MAFWRCKLKVEMEEHLVVDGDINDIGSMGIYQYKALLQLCPPQYDVSIMVYHNITPYCIGYPNGDTESVIR